MTRNFDAVSAASAVAIMGEARGLQGSHGASLIRAGLRRLKGTMSQLVAFDRVESAASLRLH